MYIKFGFSAKGDDITVSVIIPVYNREDYVASSINAIASQTYKDWEIIIVDDGSTDSSLKICREIAGSDPRIRVFPCGHHGVSTARNFGLDRARGNYIFFMDSDDLIHPCLLEQLVKVIKNSGATACSCMLKAFNDDDVSDLDLAEIDLNDKIESYQIFEGEYLIEKLFTTTFFGAIGGKMFRTDSVKNVLFARNIHKGEDTYFIYEYCLNGGSFAVCDEAWYYYRQHRTNSSTVFKREMNPDIAIHVHDLMYRREKARGKKKNARVLKKNMLGILHKTYEQARMNRARDKEKPLKERLYRMLSEDRDKAASLKRWISFLLLANCYPLYRFLKKIFKRG